MKSLLSKGLRTNHSSNLSDSPSFSKTKKTFFLPKLDNEECIITLKRSLSGDGSDVDKVEKSMYDRKRKGKSLDSAINVMPKRSSDRQYPVKLPKINARILTSKQVNDGLVLPNIHKHRVNKLDPNHIKSGQAMLTLIAALSALKSFKEIANQNKGIDSVIHHHAGRVIKRYMTRRFTKIRTRFFHLTEITRKYGLMWAVKYRCRKKRRAAAILTSFLTDLISYRLPVLLAQLRLSAIKLQRLVRGFCRITEARHKALSMLWVQMERHCNATLVPYLQEKLESKRLRKSRARSDDPSGVDSWKGAKTEGAHFPALVHGVNTASFLMAKLSSTMQKGQRLIDRCPPESIHKCITQNHLAEKLSKRRDSVVSFLQEVRRSYKAAGIYDTARKESVNMTVEDAKRMIQSTSTNIELEILFPHKHRPQKKKYPLMKVFTGEPRGIFQRMIEESVCADHGLALHGQ